MPATISTQFSRRSFLQASALGAAVFMFGYDAHGQDSGNLHLAMLSDTHIPADRLPGARGFNACEHLQRIVPELVASKADGLVIAGDAAQLTGERDDYVVLLDLLKPAMDVLPTYIALGNHDDRDSFFAVVQNLPGNRQTVEEKHVTVIEHPVVRVILLDSLMYVRKKGGFLGKTQRDWLAAYLASNTDRPVALVMHHTLGDGDNDLLDVERLFRLVEPHKHVKALFYGHSHRWELGERQGLRTINLPTSAHIWTPDQPIGWVDARFRSDGVTLTLHAIGGNTSEDGKEFDLAWT